MKKLILVGFCLVFLLGFVSSQTLTSSGSGEASFELLSGYIFTSGGIIGGTVVESDYVNADNPISARVVLFDTIGRIAFSTQTDGLGRFQFGLTDLQAASLSGGKMRVIPSSGADEYIDFSIEGTIDNMKLIFFKEAGSLTSPDSGEVTSVFLDSLRDDYNYDYATIRKQDLDQDKSNDFLESSGTEVRINSIDSWRIRRSTNFANEIIYLKNNAVVSLWDDGGEQKEILTLNYVPSRKISTGCAGYVLRDSDTRVKDGYDSAIQIHICMGTSSSPGGTQVTALGKYSREDVRGIDFASVDDVAARVNLEEEECVDSRSVVFGISPILGLNLAGNWCRDSDGVHPDMLCNSEGISCVDSTDIEIIEGALCEEVKDSSDYPLRIRDISVDGVEEITGEDPLIYDLEVDGLVTIDVPCDPRNPNVLRRAGKVLAQTLNVGNQNSFCGDGEGEGESEVIPNSCKNDRVFVEEDGREIDCWLYHESLCVREQNKCVRFEDMGWSEDFLKNVKILVDYNSYERFGAVDALSEVRTQEVVPIFIIVLEDKFNDQVLRRQVANLLWDMNSQKAISTLAKVLESEENLEMKREVVSVLQRRGYPHREDTIIYGVTEDPEAINVLVRAIERGVIDHSFITSNKLNSLIEYSNLDSVKERVPSEVSIKAQEISKKATDIYNSGSPSQEYNFIKGEYKKLTGASPIGIIGHLALYPEFVEQLLIASDKTNLPPEFIASSIEQEGLAKYFQEKRAFDTEDIVETYEELGMDSFVVDISSIKSRYAVLPEEIFTIAEKYALLQQNEDGEEYHNTYIRLGDAVQAFAGMLALRRDALLEDAAEKKITLNKFEEEWYVYAYFNAGHKYQNNRGSLDGKGILWTSGKDAVYSRAKKDLDLTRQEEDALFFNAARVAGGTALLRDLKIFEEETVVSESDPTNSITANTIKNFELTGNFAEDVVKEAPITGKQISVKDLASVCDLYDEGDRSDKNYRDLSRGLMELIKKTKSPQTIETINRLSITIGENPEIFGDWDPQKIRDGMYSHLVYDFENMVKEISKNGFNNQLIYFIANGEETNDAGEATWEFGDIWYITFGSHEKVKSDYSYRYLPEFRTKNKIRNPETDEKEVMGVLNLYYKGTAVNSVLVTNKDFWEYLAKAAERPTWTSKVYGWNGEYGLPVKYYTESGYPEGTYPELEADKEYSHIYGADYRERGAISESLRELVAILNIAKQRGLKVDDERLDSLPCGLIFNRCDEFSRTGFGHVGKVLKSATSF